MKKLTDSAQERLDKYLNEVSLCLKGAKSVDPDEIQRDITEHIEQELQSAAEPVSLDEIDQVLTRLGSPQQWAPQDELSWFRKMTLRFRTGPDDWRLAYITLGVFVLACISGPGMILLIPLSFYFARVTLKIAGGAEKLGNQKYFILPPLACFYVLLTVAGLAFPFCLLVFAEGFKHEIAGPLSIQDERVYWLLAWLITSVVAGAWWLTVGVLVRRRAVKIYYPFGERFTKKILLIICIMGGLLMVAGVILSVTWAS